MAAGALIPPPPPGFVLDEVPPPPPGFALDGAAPPVYGSYEAAAAANPLPEPYAKMRDFAYASSEAPLRAAATPKPPPDRFGENVTGANKGIYGILGAPVDAIAGALRAVASVDTNRMPTQYAKPVIDLLKAIGLDKMPEPFGGSASIQRGAEAVGVPTVEPVDRQGRVTSRIAEEIASTLVPGGVALRAGAKAKAAGKVDPTSFVAPFANAPKREMVNQTALATAAGTGAAGATEALGDSPGADIAGALFGSYAGSTAARAGGMAARAAKDVAEPRRIAREAVGTRLVDAMTDKRMDPDTGRIISAGDTAFGQNLDASRKMEADVPGLKLPAGEATMDPGIQALEFQRRSSGPNVGEYQGQRTRNRQAVNTALDEISPKAATDEATRKTLAERRDTAIATADKATTRRAEGLEDARANADPGMSRQAAGETIRSEITSSLSEARAAERDLWRSIDPEGKTEVDTRPLRDRAKAILADTPRTEAPADTSPTITDVAGKAPEPTGRAIDPDLMAEAEKTAPKALLRDKESFDEILSLKSRLSDEIRAERAAPAPNRNRIRKLSMLLDETMNTLDASAKAMPENAAAKERLDAANKASRELNERFTRGTAAEVTAVDSRGAKKVEDSELAGRFFKAGPDGSVEALEDFERAVGGRPAANKALRAYALDDAMRAAAPDGKVDTKKLEAWIAKHKDALDRYPGIRDDLGNVAAAQKSLERAARRKDMLEKGLNDPKRSTIAKYLDREDSRDSMDSILRSKNPRREMTNLVNTLKRDPDALEGAKRAFWDRMMEGTPTAPRSGIKATVEDAADTPVIKNAAFREFMTKHGDAARILYADNPQHLKRLERISEAVSAAQRTTNIKVPGTSGTPQSGTGITLAGMISRGYALQRGVVGLPYVIAESSIRGAKAAYMKVKAREFDRLLDQALMDPDVAKTLVMEWNESNQRVIARRLKLHLGHELQIGAEEAAEPDDKPKEK